LRKASLAAWQGLPYQHFIYNARWLGNGGQGRKENTRMIKVEEVYNSSTNILPGHGPRQPMKTVFQHLADGLEGDELFDRYGEGEYLGHFETEMAELFGKEAAVFMPSGTMAQQIALRIWCEKSNNFTVAMHPTAHLEGAEHLGYQYLHGIKRIQFSAPEFLGNRVLAMADLEKLGQEPGAILLELPYRPLGGELPPWEDLAAMGEWAKARRIPFHMDGARLWSCRPFYQKEYQEIASLFDSLYVSFYKDLGGIAGSMLLGPADLIREARVWQRRHGGNLTTMGPLYVSARLGVQRVLPEIDSWVQRAKDVAAIFSRFERIRVRPNPPHVNFFQLYIQGEAEALTQKHLEMAEATGTFLFYSLGATMIPGWAMTEIHCWEQAAQFDLEKLPEFLERLLEQPV
jgi:threonine aldolase